jgi:hypothetical protein
MEQLCHFVSSRGILKSCTFHSKNPQSSCNHDFAYLQVMIRSTKMKNGMSIYVCSDLLAYFVNQILPHIRNTFVLVSGDSDLCVPKEALSQTDTNKLLKSPYLLQWFAQNTRIQHNDKIIQLPIGLDYHTIFNNPSHSWKLPGENHLPRFQEEILMSLRETMKPFFERIPKIYVNFSMCNDRFQQRKDALHQISRELLEINQNFVKRTMNWQTATQYAFILCPAGNGLDCHRTWEALSLGCIPIICVPEFDKLFQHLPVLQVTNWSQINEELLKNTIQDFQNRTFDYDKLTLSYWKNKIDTIQ